MAARLTPPPLPAALADVALIDGKTAAAAAGISISQWHELVRVKDAPQPAIRAPRCTRWRLTDVRRWIIEKSSSADLEVAKAVTDQAKKASAAAQAKRKAKATQAAAAQ